MSKKNFYKQPTLTEFQPTSYLPSPLPSYIGPYRIESLLSKGGMSILYLGLHPENKSMIAVKVLSPEYVKHPVMAAQFLKEAEIIGLTNHPNIVKLYGQGEWEGGLYIAMEFIRGVSLRQFIEQHSLSMRRCIEIILQVAYALCHLHSHGVIHGDLKPENILITEDGEVKVIDFGIAKLYEEVKHAGKKEHRIVGTPTYMSPEQKEDPSKIAFTSDIYALGVIVYELFMGKLSYGTIHLSLVPKGLRRILEKALAVSITERYPTAVAFISDLSQYLKTGGLERDRPGTDQLKEVLESIQRAGQLLSPFTPPSWNSAEIGIARYKALGQGGSYFDFFKLRDDHQGIVITEPLQSGLEAPVFIATLRGMIRSLVQSQEYFQLPSLINSLQRVVKEDFIGQKYAGAFLLLSPFRDELAFISFGLGQLLHLSQGSTVPRRLSNQNPPLGVGPREEDTITRDNWNIGDLLLFHSFDSSLEAPILEGFKDNLLLSPQSQVDAILKKLTSMPSLAHEKTPKVLISLHRIE